MEVQHLAKWPPLLLSLQQQCLSSFYTQVRGIELAFLASLFLSTLSLLFG